jgi:hypothetical protein
MPTNTDYGPLHTATLIRDSNTLRFRRGLRFRPSSTAKNSFCTLRVPLAPYPAPRPFEQRSHNPFLFNHSPPIAPYPLATIVYHINNY